MKITADVREYAESLTDNEKAALYSEVGSSHAPHPEEPARGPVSKDEAQQARQRRLEQEAGMAEMSEKFKATGSEAYVEAKAAKEGNRQL